MPPSSAAGISLLVLVLGVYCHRKWQAFLPEDPPDGVGRRRHASPMPMAGFLPALVALAGFVYFDGPPLLFAAVAISTLTGYLDDRGKAAGSAMRWHTKGMFIAFAAALATVQLALDHDLKEAQWAQWVWAFVWLFAVANAVNFMDNTDGVASALGGMGLLLASQGKGPMAWAGFAYLGFLPGNWPRPQVFLGDSGSLSLGMCLGYATVHLSLETEGCSVSTLALLPLAVFAFDFAQVILARILIGIPPWEGDRRHITHIAMNCGLPTVLVAPVFAAIGYGVYVAWT